VTIEGRDPTPEELVDQLQRYHGKSPVKYDRVLRRVIRDAEHLGSDHQKAVSKFMAELAGVPTSQAKGQPWALDRYDIKLEMILKIDDQLFAARESVSLDMWEFHFKRDITAWESFLRHFVRQAVGSMAQDPEQYAYFRRKLFVVTPQDRHDSRLCRATHDTGLNESLSPKCYYGVVRRAAHIGGSLLDPELSVPVTWSDSRPLGKCGCRCHRHPLDRLDPEYYLRGLSIYNDRAFAS